MSSEGKVVLEIEVVIGTYDGLLIGLVYDLLEDNGKLRSKFQEKGHVGSVRSLAASSSGLLATGGSDEIIKLYNMRQHTEVGTIIQHDGTINCLHFHQSRHLFSASDDGTICLWSSHDWSCVHHMKGHKGPVYSIAVHPSGKLALSVGKDKTIRTWNLSTGECAYIKRLPQAAELIQWTPVGDGYVIACNNSLSVYSVQTGSIIQQITLEHHINCIVFITDELIAVGSESHDIIIYSTVTGQLMNTLKGHTSRVKSLSFISGANLLFSGSTDGTICVWNIPTDNLSDCQVISQYTVSGDVRLTSLTLVYPEELEEEEEKGRKRKRQKRKRIDESVVDEKKEGNEREEQQKVSTVMFKEEDEDVTNIKKRKKRKRNKNKSKTPKGVVTVEYEEEEKEEVQYTKKTKITNSDCSKQQVEQKKRESIHKKKFRKPDK